MVEGKARDAGLAVERLLHLDRAVNSRAGVPGIDGDRHPLAGFDDILVTDVDGEGDASGGHGADGRCREAGRGQQSGQGDPRGQAAATLGVHLLH